MRALLPAIAAALCAAALSGCGEDSEAAPQGSAVQRNGEQAIDTVQLGEQMRARMVAASDLYGLRQQEDARAQLAVASQSYDRLSPRVASAEPALDRELNAGFERVDELMAERATFDNMRDLLGPLSDQVLGGALVELVDEDARGDRGLEAEVARRLIIEMSGAFANGLGTGDERRRSLQYSYGLLARTQSIARGLSKSLGPEKDEVNETLSSIREKNFPDGLDHPTPQSPESVAESAEKVAAALERRYDLG